MKRDMFRATHLPSSGA